jgi:radical SAM PhpK family P-methyltransferase
VVTTEPTDCLLLGFYELPFPEYAEMIRSLGETSGIYRDLTLAFMDYEGQPYRALEILNRFYNERHQLSGTTLHNADFMWPVITYLTTFLRKRGLSVDYVNLPHLQKAELKRKLETRKIRSVAITTTLYVSPEPIIELAAMVRRLSPHTKIIVGGPFVTNQAKAVARPGLARLFDRMRADIYVLCQEGESTLAMVVNVLKSGRDLRTVPNLALRGPQGYTYTEEKPESNDLAEEPVNYADFPASELEGFVTIRTAKSCPFSCAFCGFPTRAGKYTYLDLGHVERELDAIFAQGNIGTVTILDDTFNVPKKRFRDILQLMIRKNYGFRWNSFYRSDHGDEETIRLMAEAGCEGVFLGVESGSDRMLKAMNKMSRRKHYVEAIAAFSANRISTYASLIIGFPGETDETVAETIAFIEEARPEYFRAQLWYADPMTPIWKDREKYGLIGQGFAWKHDTMDAERACDWIDEMFLGIANSTWLPQLGFEQWATFYLQRKGMSRDGVRHFVMAFNSAIKHRMVSYGASLPSQIVRVLKESAKFPAEQPAELAPLEPWTGARYRSAAQALEVELAEAPVGPARTLPTYAKFRQVDSPPIEMPRLAAALLKGDEDARIDLLAAYAAGVKKAHGDGVILVALGGALDGPPVPMHFRTDSNASWDNWRQEARSKWERLLPYADLLARIFDASPSTRLHGAVWRCCGLLRLPSHKDAKTPPWMARIGRWGISDVVIAGTTGRSVTFDGLTTESVAALKTQISGLERLLHEAMSCAEQSTGGR